MFFVNYKQFFETFFWINRNFPYGYFKFTSWLNIFLASYTFYSISKTLKAHSHSLWISPLWRTTFKTRKLVFSLLKSGIQKKLYDPPPTCWHLYKFTWKLYILDVYDPPRRIKISLRNSSAAANCILFCLLVDRHRGLCIAFSGRLFAELG